MKVGSTNKTKTDLGRILNTQFLSFFLTRSDCFDVAFVPASAELGVYVGSFFDRLALFVFDLIRHPETSNGVRFVWVQCLVRVEW